jgi:porin
MFQQKNTYYLILILINFVYLLPLSASDLSKQRFKYKYRNEYNLAVENNDNKLKITEDIQLIIQESSLNIENQNYPKQYNSGLSKQSKKRNNNKSQLTAVVWQLEEIRDNNDQLITVDSSENYTIEFLADGQLNIQADCNRARGTYMVENSSISMTIGATTRAMCPPESISDKYLKELQSVTIFFFQDGNLYIDLRADTGTMKFIPQQEKNESSQLENNRNNLGFGGPNTVENELQEDQVSRKKRSLLSGVDNALQPWFDWKQQVNEDIGLNFGLDYNTVYQKYSRSLNFDEAGGGIFRFFADWTLVGRNTSYPGSIVFKVENRHDYSKVAPQNLGFQAGYSGITSTQFSDFDWGITNLFWKQKFNNGRISFLIGKVDPTDYVNVYALINPLTHFQNLAFLSDPSIASPNQGLGMALGAMLTDNVYLVTGFSDANGDPTKAGFDSFFDDAEYFKHIEIGWTSSQERIYFDNIHLTAWHSDEREEANVPESWGLAFSATWFVDDKWLPFFRAGYSDGGASLMKGSISTGVGRYFAESGNVLGFGVNWGQPADTSLDSQVTTELFYRIQITQNWAITPDIQVLFNPALDPDKSAIAVFAIRSRINF